MKRSIHSACLTALLLAAVVAPTPISARAAAPNCAPAPEDAAVAVADLSSGGDVALADGRSLRLAGLDLPGATEGAPDLPSRVRAGLLAWATGPVLLHPLSAAPDRWGRISALLFRLGGPSAAAALVEAGLARVAPEPAARACAADLLAAEDRARAARRGLWADPRYAVLRASDAEALSVQAGGLALVEGILRVHESRGALYLALGRRGSGFAAVVSRRDRRGFAKAGIDLRDYVGTPVRLRGDLDARFGPRLRVAGPDGFESLEPGSIVDEPPAPRPAGEDGTAQP